MATYAYTFNSGDTVTPTRINDARTVSDIVNADVSATAAIAGTKVAPAFGGQDITVSGANRSITNTGNFALSFGTNNTERVRIDNAGNVGINANSPTRRLEVAIDAAPAATLAQKTALLLKNNNATGTGGSPCSAALQFAFDPSNPTASIEAGTFGENFFNFTFGSTTAFRINALSGFWSTTGDTKKRFVVDYSSDPVVKIGLPDWYDTGSLAFVNGSGGERMRIDASGDIFIGASAATAQGKTQITFDGATKQGVNIVDSSSAASSTAISFIKSSDTRGSITVTASATAYNTSSDYRLKQNVEPLAGGLAKLKSLAPKTFEFKVEPDVKVDGFIAHEVQAVVPQAVTGEKDGEQMQGLDMSKLVPVLVAAVQELTAKVEALEAA
jgi:hypothetical protein